jgi:ribosomal protein S18 acetylase RimI-like enzyme
MSEAHPDAASEATNTAGSPPVEVTEATEVTPELVAAFERLVPQLSSSNPPPSADELAAIVASPASVLLIARDPARGGEIVGSLTLALFRIPTGLRAWIEDVVVDGGCRGRGVGAALNRYALERARQAGAKTVDLTSRPSREVANRLYQRLGFELRDTNVYRFDLD